jgi:hypothetical protein
MTKVIIRYGIIAGLIVALPWVWIMARLPTGASLDDVGGMVQGYIIMIVGLTMVFLGIKHYRDRVLGGVIRFGQAFLVGLGITVVASIFYVVGWEIASAISHFDFANAYAQSMIEAARAKGANAAELAKASADAADFTRMYANPMFRLPMVFIEIFPVGLLVSLISAAVLRNSRILPARASA